MELRQLKTFQVVAGLLSFHRAAEILNYAPSTVSTQIRLLEEELGVPLFDRLGKRVRLTSAGRMLTHYGRKLLDIEKEASAKVSGWEEPYGTISIRIPQSIATYLLPSVLKAFQKRYPKVGFDVSTCAYEQLIHEFKTGMIDLAFLLADSIPFSEMQVELLRVEPLVMVSSPHHELAENPDCRLKDLVDHSILLPKHDCSYKMQFEQMLIQEKINRPTIMELNCIEAIKQCVLKKIGVAMLPMMAVRQELTRGEMKTLPLSLAGLETGVLMIRYKGKWISPMLKSFMDTVREVLKAPKEPIDPCRHP